MALGDRFFYVPSRTVHDHPSDWGHQPDEVQFPTSDGERLHGWFFPVRDADTRPRSAADRAPDRRAATILHIHGNAENLTVHFQLILWLTARFNVFCFDYRGYGRSTGRISRAGTITDTHAALDYLLTRPDVDPARIAAFGQSIGGAIGIVVTAARSELRALAIESGFHRYRAIAAYHFPLAGLLTPLLVSADHDPLDSIARISPRPLFVIATEADRICPAKYSRALYEAAGEPKQWYCGRETAHLETVADNEDDVQAALLRFFTDATAPRAADAD